MLYGKINIFEHDILVYTFEISLYKGTVDIKIYTYYLDIYGVYVIAIY